MFKRRRRSSPEVPPGTPRKRRVEGYSSSRSNPVLRLQGRLGNAETSRLIQALHYQDALQRQPEEEEEEVQTKFDPGLAQRQPEEEEEELQTKFDPGLAQRQEEEEEIEMSRDTRTVPQVGLEGGAVPDATAAEIDRQRGSGAELEGSLRDRMETAFGTSFDQVRVHQDAKSDGLARNMAARAFTTGNDVFLRGDASPGDRDLIAHELTHVVQQRVGSGQPGGMTVRPAGDQLEVEADQVAAQVNRTDQPEEQAD